MKHILTLGAVLISLTCLSAQFDINVDVSWPDGMPCDVASDVIFNVVDPDGTLISSDTIPLASMSSWYLFVNPLILNNRIMEFGLIGEVDPLERFTVLDLLKLQKILFGLLPVENALQQVIGDVNNSGTLSALDLVEMRKMLLGLYQEWPNMESVTFYERNSADPPPVGAILSKVIKVPYSPGLPNVDLRFWAVAAGDIHY